MIPYDPLKRGIIPYDPLKRGIIPYDPLKRPFIGLMMGIKGLIAHPGNHLITRAALFFWFLLLF